MSDLGKYMKKILGISFALLLAGCGEDSATRAIEASGFKNVRLTGFVWWGCDNKTDSPFFNTKFAAEGLNGKPVNGVACGGFLKGWTVRID